MPGPKCPPPKDVLEKDYNSTSIRQMSFKYGCTEPTVRKWLLNYGIKIRLRGPKLSEGEQINEWTLLEKVGPNKWGSMIWKVRCSCGRVSKLAAGHLRFGAGKSCGHGRFTGFKGMHGKYWKGVLQRARMRGLSVEITAEDAWNQFEKQKGICAISGIEITLGNSSKATASLDRICSKRGYTKDNIQWVHKHINMMKRAHTDEYFIEMCKTVATYNNKRDALLNEQCT